MRQLLLLRHAKSTWDDPKLADHARPINARGRAAAVAQRGRMRELGLLPDVILVSSARRTLQTMEALAPWDETPLIEPMDALYLANDAQMIEVIRGVPETVRSVLVIGHNPGMHDLAVRLMGRGGSAEARARLVQGYPTATLTEFAVTGPWSAVDGGTTGLVRFLGPADDGSGDSLD